jgi:hypothetical protein
VAADEVIYVVGALNLIERGSLDTNFYLPDSLIRQGHPHRDVHMPGYVFALAPFVAALGPGLAAVALLNVLALVLLVLLVHAVARSLRVDPHPAAAAAALVPLLPPFPGYLYVAFPELLLPLLLLAGVWLSSGGVGAGRAALAGALYGVGPLFRENLLIALPIYAVLLPGRLLLRAFLPAAATVAALVYAVFGPGRAQLPNDVYPAILFESLRSARPAATLWRALEANVGHNLGLLAGARPWDNPEDGVLLLLLLLTLAAAGGALALRGRVRRVGLAAAASMLLVGVAVVVLYAVRATGRPWAGVRQFMAWQPLLLVFAVAGAWRLRRGRGPVLAAAAGVCLALSLSHVRFVNEEWKGRDLRRSRSFVRHVGPWLDPLQPKRIAVRSNNAFLYGLTRYPVEVIWPIRSLDELAAVERVVQFEFLVLPRSAPMLAYLEGNARYRHLNTHDPDGRFYIWQRLY